MVVQHSRLRWMRKAEGVEKMFVCESNRRAKDLTLWRSVACYDVCELEEQAWLNEFQGDSFRLFSSPHLWNENATLHLEFFKKEFRKNGIICESEIMAPQ